MMKPILSALVVTMALSVPAFADQQQSQPADAQSSLKIKDVSGQKNKVPGDIDQEITNAKLRAESGSKSKWSITTNLAYTGGSITRAFGVKRPDIKGSPSSQRNTSFDFGPSIRYRWTKNDSIQLGTLFGLVTPFQGNVGHAKHQIDVYDPSLEYDRVGKLWGLQTQASAVYLPGTSNTSLSQDETSNFYVSYTGLKVFQNGLTIGMAVDSNYYLYSTRPGQNQDHKNISPMGYYGNDARAQWTLGVYPFAEYAFNDTYSLRTVFGYFNWQHLYGDAQQTRLLQEYVYQSVGIGISVSRNVYLYPNIQFLPGDMSADKTNVALSATINTF